MLNANDGLSQLQIKDGALNNISTLLDRLSTLATQSASSASTANRTVLNNEFQDVLSEIDREANVAGLTASTGFSVFLSSNGSNGVVGGTIGASTVSALGLTGKDVSTAGTAATAVAAISTAIANLGTTQASVGTIENRLSYAISLSQTQAVNDQAAESRLRDANVADESAQLTKHQDPDPERSVRPGAGQLVEQRGSQAVAVVHWSRAGRFGARPWHLSCVRERAPDPGVGKMRPLKQGVPA